MEKNKTIALKTSDEIHRILDTVLTDQNGGKPYCHVRNQEGKEWLFYAQSRKSLSLGLNIYEPASLQGKLIKYFLPVFHSILERQNRLMIQGRRCTADFKLQDICRLTFHIRGDCFFNFFLGTPSVHQKIVVQADDGTNVLGYIKFSENPAVLASFEYEYKYLRWLRERGIKNVPEPLSTGWLDQGRTIGFFLQSCQKRRGSYSQLKLNESALAFLKEMESKTNQYMRFEDSEYYAVVKTLGSNIKYYPGDREKLLMLSEKIISAYRGTIVEYSACHGDFTPWNSFFDKKGKCYAFDFEYAIKSGPPMQDAFHWLMSVYLLKKHYGVKKILKEFKREKALLKKYVLDVDESFLLYLLYYTAFYLKRDGKALTGKNLENVMICTQLMEHCCIQTKKGLQ